MFVALRQAHEAEFSHVFCRTLDRDIDPVVSMAILPHTIFAEKMEWIL